MTDKNRKLIEEWLQPCAVVPIETATVRILLNALRERLTQPQRTHWEGCEEVHPECKKPEQEPVAWRNAALRVGEDLCSVGPFGYYDMTAQQWLDWALSVVTCHPPPRREWVGLTDEEVKALPQWFPSHETAAVLPLIRAIEAKLKEKNT